MSVFDKIFADKNAAGSVPQAIVDTLNSERKRGGKDGFAGAGAAGLSLGLEGYADDALALSDLQTSVGQLSAALESISIGSSKVNFTAAQKQAGMIAAGFSGNLGAVLSSPLTAVAGAIPAPSDLGRIKPALESYDEKENRAAAVYTVAYNLQAARQDEFGEAFYPTVTVAPDQQGYHIQIQLVNLINEIRRKTSGDLDNWNRKNIVHVVRNPGLIQSDSTKLVPIYRDDSKHNFVDAAVLATRDVPLNGETVTTSALAVGKTFSLLGISQTSFQLDTAMMDETDSIDTDIRLKKIYVKVGEDVVSFEVDHIMGSTFVYPVQGDSKRMDVRFETEALQIRTDTKKVGGGDLVTLAPLVAADLHVSISVGMFGSVVTDIGKTQMTASPVQVVKLVDATGDVHLPSSVAHQAIVDLFAGAQVIGYELDARRTNLNRRSIGQMLETRQESQAYAVPLLSPVTIKRPQGLSDATDASDLAALVTLTRAMASGLAVDELFRARDLLSKYKDDRAKVGDSPMVLGIARHLITPYFDSKEIKIESTVNSLNSVDLAANIQATMINVIRDMVYTAYQESGYKAANDLLAGGEGQTPEVIIGTDQTLARYLMVTGDLRTIGEGFGVPRIVWTQNDKMKGRIFVTFGVRGAAEGVPHPLHFGNMAWKPEVTVVLPIHRNGANNKELTVQPSFRHVTNLPILLEITVTGIPETVDTRVPVLALTKPAP